MWGRKETVLQLQKEGGRGGRNETPPSQTTSRFPDFEKLRPDEPEENSFVNVNDQSLHSPHRQKRPNAARGVFEVQLLQDCPTQVFKCFGCGQTLKPNDVIGQPPFDLVIVSKVQRHYFDNNGLKQSKEGNVYFHAVKRCIISKQPYFDTNCLRLSFQLQLILKPAHERHLQSEFNIGCYNFPFA